MRRQLLIPLAALIFFACVNFTSAKVGGKITKYCKESMGSSNNPKVFCRAIADRVVQKAYIVCRKGVTWACKVAKLTGVDYKTCKTSLLEHVCPKTDVPPALDNSELEGSTPVITSEEEPMSEETEILDDDDDDDDYDDDYYDDDDDDIDDDVEEIPESVTEPAESK